MRFVASKRFLLLLVLGIIPLSLSWQLPAVRPFVLAFDVLLIVAAAVDLLISRGLPAGLSLRRELNGRFAIGDPAKVAIVVENDSPRTIQLRIKDEYPPEMKLTDDREAAFKIGPREETRFEYWLTPPRRGLYHFGRIAVRYRSVLGLLWCQTAAGEPSQVKVYPNMRRAREMELKALGPRSYMAVQRKAIRRGEGREFESMRDYVRGDELRHISWTATARRSKLITRQYQIERDQTVIIAIDAGRLMTGRIDGETKFDTAIHAALALMSACSKAGDNVGLVVFGRRVIRSLPAKRGMQHIDAVLEALYGLEPEMVEPSYPRAFRHIASASKKRSFVVVLTDLVDRESSNDLLTSLRLLRPRHLPMVVTIGDRDLNTAVSKIPESISDVFTQSASEEVILQRESALRTVESIGGLALDVTTKTLAPKLLQTYIKVKEKGLL